MSSNERKITFKDVILANIIAIIGFGIALALESVWPIIITTIILKLAETKDYSYVSGSHKGAKYGYKEHTSYLDLSYGAWLSLFILYVVIRVIFK